MGTEECFSPQIGPSEARLQGHTSASPRRSADDVADRGFVPVVRARGFAAGGGKCVAIFSKHHRAGGEHAKDKGMVLDAHGLW